MHRHILPRILEAGFLFSVQSLLSTRGDELGMLEDMVIRYICVYCDRNNQIESGYPPFIPPVERIAVRSIFSLLFVACSL